MHNNIIYKKKSNKKIIKTKWILINTLLLCIGAFTMEIAILKELEWNIIIELKIKNYNEFYDEI